jgi:hypothetical protein
MKKHCLIASGVLLAFLILVPPALVSVETGSFAATGTNTAPVFVWFFGYVGGQFYPQTELGISEQQMISEAATLSSSIGSTTSLRCVAAVDQLPGNAATIINWNNATEVADIQSYVNSLNQYGQVYARIDLEEFNWSSSPTVYQEVSNLSGQIGVAGIWFDHAAVLYGSDEAAFNTMMQTLTTTYPNLIFILNQSTRSKTGGQIIAPSSGMTWNETTYISPSVLINTYNQAPPKTLLTQYNSIYPGRVLLHFDSYAQTRDEPMGIFAEQKPVPEENAVQSLAKQGATQASENAGFTLLYPIIGGWTYNGILASGDVNYHGTLYDSLSIGTSTYSRATVSHFITTMKEYP